MVSISLYGKQKIKSKMNIQVANYCYRLAIQSTCTRAPNEVVPRSTRVGDGSSVLSFRIEDNDLRRALFRSSLCLVRQFCRVSSFIGLIMSRLLILASHFSRRMVHKLPLLCASLHKRKLLKPSTSREREASIVIVYARVR